MRPAMRLGLSLATIGRGGVGRDGRRRRALPARACRGSSRCCSARSPRPPTRPRCSPCCARPAAAPAHRRARGRVRAQRRADRRAGDADLAPGPSRTHGVLGQRPVIVFELIAGGVIGAAIGCRRRVGDAPGGPPVLRPLPARGPVPALLGVRRRGGRARLRVRRGLRRRAVLGNSELPHRAATRSFSEGVAWLAQIGLFVMLGLLLSPVAHRPRTIVVIAARRRPRAHARGAAAVGPRQRARAADGAARAGVPVVGRPARCGADRAGHDPARRGRRRRRASSSTSSS